MTTPSSTPTPFPRRTLLRGLGGAVLLGAAGTAPALASPSATTATGRIKSVAYVEVNSNSLANVGRYTLAGSGAPVFDFAVIFAANINYDGTNAVLYNNPQVQATLDSAATTIRPLQQKGIKVLLSILGNHQGAGFANFPDYASADRFAAQLAATVTQYGLDGIDFDDEWAEYGKNGTGQPNDFSFVYLLDALRKRLPDKLITFYYIGPASQHLSYGGQRAGDLVNYAWNPYYGSYNAPVIDGMGADRLAAAAVDLNNTSTSTMKSFAQRTKADGYGVYVTYDLRAGNYATTLSSFTQELYGSAAVYS
ncbi:endo-beta-N-acetylglucosaminidase H [Arthrobacter sp. NPDC090010]|uniref:endo-beta-N-acetylglucosaminidase H n=1 Tax=Arthrobacter sp. NPDC090010 TaxID=3363942 RepID=UPI00380765D1